MKESFGDIARREIEWYFSEAEGEACGLRSSGWNVLEESDGGARGSGGAGVRHFVDPYPDTKHREGARRRLTRVSRAFEPLASHHKAVLEARFTARSPRAVGVRGMPEFARVALLLPSIQRRAELAKTTVHEAAKAAARQDEAGLRKRCEALVDEALHAFTRSMYPQLAIKEMAR
jgi:hypothetical protein